MSLKIKEFHHKSTSTLSYIVYDDKTKDALILDPVLDFDPANGKVWGESAEKLIHFIRENKLRVGYSLETHAHADHLSGAQLIKKTFHKMKVGIGARIIDVQGIFKKTFNLSELKTDGSQFDRIFSEGETLNVGSIKGTVHFAPGHTPACVVYEIGDALFVGDVIFHPELGTGRCDFPGGEAAAMFHSVTNLIYKFPDHFRIFFGHDYPPAGQEYRFQSTVGEEKTKNIHIKAETTLADFVNFRVGRDKTLSAPQLLLPSIQVNINAGQLPEKEKNGVSYLKIPLQVTL